MANMVPEDLKPGAAHASEVKVYAALKTLPDEYRVFHSVTRYSLPSNGRPLTEGEADFVILHPDKGLLVLEAKGGEIEYEGRTRTWLSSDRNFEPHKIDDPFLQAQRNQKAIAREIEKYLGTQLVHGHGVVFPDCEYRLIEEKQPIGQPRELVIDAADLAKNVTQSIERIYAYWAAGRPACPLGARTLKKISQNVLAPHFNLGLSLATRLADEESALLKLSYEQDVCLDFLGLNSRTAIEGGAGTGKTVIALEAARRHAVNGRHVLLLCFNLPLAGLLREKCRALDVEPGSIRAATFHEICQQLATDAGLAWSRPPLTSKTETERFYNETAPRLLDEASRLLPARFDALVVDEAQDFLPSWWPTLLGLLKCKASDPFVAFLDPEQDLWNRNTVLPPGLPRFPLRLNQRNTRAIANYFAPLGACNTRFTPHTPHGEPVVVKIYSSTDDQRKTVEDQIRHLLFHEEIDASRVAILGTHHIEHSFLKENKSLCGIPVAAIDDDGNVPPGTLRYSTPRRFKGLEADILLFCDVDGEGHAGTRRDLYVAMSRARLRLYVFHKEGVPIESMTGEVA